MRNSFSIAILVVIAVLLLFSCKNAQKEDVLAITDTETYKTPASVPNRNLSQEFKDYWYAGSAEITSYRLMQERYGELREGTAVNIFVTEDFLPEIQVKADRSAPTNVPILKFNGTKKYLTGIYPYSVMNSTFYPVQQKDHALKVSYSMQEWCGHVYMQLNNRNGYEIESHSYFEGEADQELKFPTVWLESELWNLIRISPEELPTGNFEILPGFEFARMSHKKLEVAEASATLEKENGLSTYTLSYPKLNRTLSIQFTSDFPYAIESWEESHPNGLTTTAEKIKRMKAPYW
eukprot:CAMPEP_0198312098 /NCGR_PEP_ID=MMETSP1450-20131203/3609_1 /TAXON_ID=753684 ORGANISM="Madagascaria erythrocladiodes, Strain CCMP3234" /NCGR_SAMPLE_ID=MMETSP1450 /ASSEMBLY_ACC=CAM_ASM_001115 /LENGTH=291 /DNA_ID=CAMNT_0044015033 /DNA_START=17 /DNA_END=889 /DNA_ORIENTATION=+